MSSYESFASVYDLFMSDVDYDEWVEYIGKLWKKFNIKPELVCDLGCGTGNISLRLSKKGYDVIGIDISEDMLSKARQKAVNENLDVLFLLQDMREFELYGTVNCIVCLCDSLNYITCEEDVLTVFRLVNNYLHPNGLFIFDLNTEYKFKNIYGDNTFSEITDDAAYIWENYYDEDEQINEYYLNFFVKNCKGSYDRTDEEHYERAYSLDTIKSLIEQSGLKFEAAYDAFTFEPVKNDSERIYVVAREVQKEDNINE
ncbi:MAG: class I SAM-dependent methyltransferase [Candidatus Metalachnospira sp.]|nr:class I SAM-dependent methyltransferase [Candidatus Metalachnospira sp.]